MKVGVEWFQRGRQSSAGVLGARTGLQARVAWGVKIENLPLSSCEAQQPELTVLALKLSFLSISHSVTSTHRFAVLPLQESPEWRTKQEVFLHETLFFWSRSQEESPFFPFNNAYSLCLCLPGGEIKCQTEAATQWPLVATPENAQHAVINMESICWIMHSIGGSWPANTGYGITFGRGEKKKETRTWVQSSTKVTENSSWQRSLVELFFKQLWGQKFLVSLFLMWENF